VLDSPICHGRYADDVDRIEGSAITVASYGLSPTPYLEPRDDPQLLRLGFTLEGRARPPSRLRKS